MFQRVLLPIVFSGSALLLGCAPDPWSTTPPEFVAAEIADHRMVPIAPVRSAHTCTGANAADSPGWDEVISVRVRVGQSGAVSLKSVGGTDANGQSLVEASCVSQIVRQAESWRYRPFQIDGRAVAREFDEQISVLVPERWREDARPFPPIADLSQVRIVLERGGCLGACPVYRVELRGDGGVTFEGLCFVDQAGVHQSSIDQDAFATLLHKFRDARFFALLDEYSADVTDMPAYQLTVEIDGHRARVLDYVGAHEGMPLVVRELEDEVDRVANTAQWIGRGGDR